MVIDGVAVPGFDQERLIELLGATPRVD